MKARLHFQAESGEFDYPSDMKQAQLLLISHALIALTLVACGRDTYTTWNCRSQTEPKITMVLNQAEMRFKELKLAYCGSLGKQSYFAQDCLAQIQESRIVFTPSSGLLIDQGQQYECSEL